VLREVEESEREALRSGDRSVPDAGAGETEDCYELQRSNAASSRPPSVAPSSGEVA